MSECVNCGEDMDRRRQTRLARNQKTRERNRLRDEENQRKIRPFMTTVRTNPCGDDNQQQSSLTHASQTT